MKKYLVSIVGVFIFLLVFASCTYGKTPTNDVYTESPSYLVQVESRMITDEFSDIFVQIYRGYDYRLVYHKDTKVMYVVSDGRYNSGTFTVMLNADGTPMVWEEVQ